MSRQVAPPRTGADTANRPTIATVKKNTKLRDPRAVICGIVII